MKRNFLSVVLLLCPVLTEAAARSCPFSWYFYGGYCFRAIFGNTHYNYERANIACGNEGARLASIHSSEELGELRDNLYPSGQFYIGLKRNSEGEWMYNDTSSYDYSKWEISEPAIHEGCVVLNPDTFKWFGESCYLTVDGALCRKPLDDREPPRATCVNTTVEVPPSVTATPVNFVEPVIVDESSPVTIQTRSRQNGGIFQKGVTQVVYSFQDAALNIGHCTFFVTVKEADLSPPTVICFNFSVTVPLNSSGTNVTFREPEAFDTSSHVIITSQSHKPGLFFEVGETAVNYNYSDASGNSENCTFTVRVERADLTPPWVTCNNFTDALSLESSAKGKNVSFEEPEAIDNSGQVIITSRSHEPGDFFEEGGTEVSYTFADVTGNNESCSFYVIVQRIDLTPPLVTCKNFTDTLSLESPAGGKNVSFEEPIATDNSGQVTTSSRSRQPGDFFEEGETEVSYTFSDATGNNESCSFYVIVQRTDMTPPSVDCKNFTETTSNEHQTKRVHFVEPKASDNSGHVKITSQTHQPGDFFPLGDTTVTYTFSDASHNIKTCSFIVAVRKDEEEKEEEISPELERIVQFVEAGNRNFTLNVTQVSEELADFTSSTPEPNKKEVDAIADILSVVSSFNSSSPTVTSLVFEVTDDIITAEEMGENVLSANSSEIILQSFERQLENVQRNGQNFSETGQNIAVNVVHLQNFEAPVGFASFSTSNDAANVTGGLGDTYLLNRSLEVNDAELVSIQLYPEALLDAFPPGQDTLPISFIVHRTDALFQNSKTENSHLEVNSLIIAASTSVPIRNLPPESLVMTTFLPVNKSLFGKPQCMFWNHTLHGNLGGWSGEGCYLEESDTSEVLSCYCNHLTSFAILVNPSGDVDHEFVSILTLVGCIISIICLTLTIVSLSASPNIRSKTPQKIIIHLSLALVGLYLFFLIGVNRKDLQIGCVIFGALIHFFCLASIAWMSVEATNMYLMFVKVINANVRYFLLKASLFAWGFPLVIVLSSAIVSPESYKIEDTCFPHHDTLVFYVSVFSLVALLLVYNLVIFILVVWKLTYSRKNISSASNTRRDTIRRLQNAFAISVLLGITWAFGLFPMKDHTLHLLFSILFCLFNSLQGCFIFLLFGLRQKEVRTTWKKWLLIQKRREDATMSTGFSSQTDQGKFGNKNGRKRPESDVSAKTDVARSNVEMKGL